ncbi:MAG: right-handed parallel beta-helix repeat-containing protein, partial [Lacipirellulaceae bacterium]
MKVRTLWGFSWGTVIWGIVVWSIWGTSAHAFDYLVSSDAELTTALNSAAQGDNILLEPGIYSGGRYRLGLTGVTIRSSDPGNRAIIRGGINGIQLSAPQSVTLEDLIFEQQTFNGINIDDNGNLATPASDITLRRVTFRDVGSTGNHDGVKLSGVRDFLLDQVEVFDWGEGGSAVDMVGSHRGLIQNSYFRDTDANAASGIRPKGGSKDITIRANRIELPSGAGRAIQAGGSTGPQFFRFIDGDSDYEADSIIAEGNVVLGAASSFSFVNIDGGLFHHNYAERPDRWNVRILNENQGNTIVDTQN